ncbi:MAG: hypothetical protein JWM11_1511, partial [Planctomycetaceae bacterium]|nr:hypothetical protein [Planctomycetaceae bacterium]
RIYLFDDQGTEEEQSKPIYQFDFEPEAWQLHSSMTELGPAYNVFIPYTRKGRNQANCALRIRYNPPSGTPVFSQMATLTLGGTKNIDLKGAKPADDEASTFKSTTIDVAKSPKKMQVTQVNAEEPARSTRTTSQPHSALQTAGFETPADETGVQSRVEPADYQTKTELHTHPEVDKENPFGDLTPDKPAVRTYSIQVD